MILLSADHLTRHFGPEPVLAGVSFDIRPGEKWGLVGPNGTGKTTLLKILSGRDAPDSGQVRLHPSATLAYLEQQPSFAPGRTVWDEAAAGLGRLRQLAADAEELARRLAHTNDPVQHRRLAARYDQLHHRLELLDAYHLDHRVERVLQGLGFPAPSFQQPAAQLSGGQQNRLLLAQMLLAGADLMLLDEPSNHLDLEATAWLEEFLAAAPQALLLVSHDRYFLDRVTNRTLELYQGTVEPYQGGFSAYWRQKSERLEVQRRTFDNQQEQIAKTEDFIRRNLAGQKTKQAKDRVKKLARLERVAPPREIAAPPMAFSEPRRTGDIVLRLEHLSMAYDRPLFRDLNLEINRGQRWGIVGPNGSGKTTLLRCALGQQVPDAGRVVLGAGVDVGYFDQLLAGLDPQAQVVDAVRPPRKEFVEQQRRDLLARFGITGDQVFQPVASLSGGERNRLALASLAAADANFLVLDEPTNHLDLWGRDALERALRGFSGTVLLVSHDRYFLNRVVDHLLVLDPAGPSARVVYGNFDAWRQLASGASASAASPAPPRPAERPAAPPRKRKFPYRKLADLEAEIHQHEARLQRLNAALADPDLHRHGDQVRRTLTDLAECREHLAALYEHWEEAQEL